MTPEEFKPILTCLKAGLDASLDPVCAVNTMNQVIYMSLPMRNLLGVRPRDLAKGVILCDLIQLGVCKQHCQILDVLRTGTPLRLDETPASKDGHKLRLTLKAVPFYEGGLARGTRPLGAIVAIRDSTGEILLQAKYHKLMEMLKDKDGEIADVQERLRLMQKTLRGARESSM